MTNPQYDPSASQFPAQPVSPAPASLPPSSGMPQSHIPISNGLFAPVQSPSGTAAPGGQPQNTWGLIGMILGIAAIPASCCVFLGLPLGIAGGVLGWMGYKKATSALATNRTQALTGIICGAIGVALCMAFLFLWAVSSISNLSGYGGYGLW